MKVRETFVFTDEDRRAINNYYGRKGKATHEELRIWLDIVVGAALDDHRHDLTRDEERE